MTKKATKKPIISMHELKKPRRPFVIEKASVEELNKPLHKAVNLSGVVSVQKLRYAMSKSCYAHNIIYKESSTKPEAVKHSAIKNWLKKFDNVLGYDDPVEFMDFIIRNWRDICSGMRGAGHTLSFLNNSFVFDTLNFFERPTHREAIIDFIDTLHYMSSKQKYFEDRHKKAQDSVFAPPEAHEPVMDDDVMERMRKRFSKGAANNDTE